MSRSRTLSWFPLRFEYGPQAMASPTHLVISQMVVVLDELALAQSKAAQSWLYMAPACSGAPPPLFMNTDSATSAARSLRQASSAERSGSSPSLTIPQKRHHNPAESRSHDFCPSTA
mmetsp:Transcript_100117/g.172825  ORF Transcript_100117/g.172825 Transcript_100117/m.172825 type:complete len:117 (+) Transcript_100117:1801-2151(+)